MKSKDNMVFLFSGQGSQYGGMGEKLFKKNAIFRNSLEQSEVIVQKQLSRSLIEELYYMDEYPFDDLLITHPAIVAVEIAMYRVLQEKGITPDYVAGSSLGEFAAGVASGVWAAESAIEAAIEQAKSIVSNDVSGGMLAVIHENKYLEPLYLKHQLYLAADNFEGHFTLAGLAQHLDAFQAELNKLDIQFLRLPVNYPFHSPQIEYGRHSFMYNTGSASSLAAPNAGFISGVYSKELSLLPDDYFWKAISCYMNFPATVAYLENRGACCYIDVGPSGTGATFVKYNLNHSSTSHTFQIMTPYKRELEQLERLQGNLRL
ncbi:MAG TPA: acyltransferase domain-containing protein [Chitinophaga sp.]|uniref:acyltransferase domain-containing protein n=1 Tax=Chitinophaga sp. TaxID=1869181 RepID=UPI002C2BDD08|nr:acyltransferase domain-containing protein [Chitinophaga sp.]HVI45328.1 acyltransferase domain-containing protein [Chitinophaga sp.]